MSQSQLEMGTLERTPSREFENDSLVSPVSVSRKAQSSDHDSSSPDTLQTPDSTPCRNFGFRSFKVVVFTAKLNILMIFAPTVVLVNFFYHHDGLIFGLSLLGLIPMAERLGFVTEQLSFFTGSTVGGLLNATFGNAFELIISVHALKSDMVLVVQQSMLGSILSNILLVLGLAFVTGGMACSKDQSFNKAATSVNSVMLLMAVMGLLFPTVLYYSNTESHIGKSVLELSRFSSCIMLAAYGFYLYYQLKSHRNLYDTMCEDCKNVELSKWESIVWLVILTFWISIISGYLVGALQGASISWNVPIAFISVILLPMVGNTAECASSIMFAMKDKLDISLGVAIGSSTQIAMFVIPFCVVLGWIMGCKMDLNFHPFETAALFVTVLVVGFIVQDGNSNYFKGLLLILCYMMVAAGFFVHIDYPTEAPSPK